MNETNQKIINAVLQKCEKYCPGAIEILGVYGSAATGDTHAKSDLDLLIVCEGESAGIIADAFILDDTSVGYDIYCTPWSRLEADAKCTHANLAKLLDSKIVYHSHSAALERLHKLRQEALSRLASEERHACAASALERAKLFFADCITAESLSDKRLYAAACMSFCFDALMLSKGKYFKLGVKRNLSELELSSTLEKTVGDIVFACDEKTLTNALTELVRTVKTEITAAAHAPKPSPGTCEEMYSNWKSKMELAAKENDAFSAFMNITSFQYMLSDCCPADRAPSALSGYDPHDLEASQRAFDRALEEYGNLCREAGITPRSFANVDEFLSDYLK